MGVFSKSWMKLLVAGGLTFKRARIVTSKISAIITECRCAVAKVRHERAAKEGAEAAKRRQEQQEREVREYHERDGRQMSSGGKQPLVQLMASGAAHQRCYVRRRKRVEDDRAKVAEEEVRVNELRARSRAGKERLARISERTLQEWQGTMDGGRIPISQPKKRRRKRLRKHNGLESGGGSVDIMARDNGRRENPDIPAKEKEEAEAIAKAQWTGIWRG
jgi:hypothetical protein